MLHGLDDDLVPASQARPAFHPPLPFPNRPVAQPLPLASEQAKTLFEACGVMVEHKKLYLIDGCGHDDLSDDERRANRALKPEIPNPRVS